MFTKKEKINASMAFLTYVKETIGTQPNAIFDVAKAINAALPTYPNLENDWQIVWGPALFHSEYCANKQANLTFVAQSRSNPASYIVATRGTNADNTWEWLAEDFDAKLIPWITPKAITPTPYICRATTTGLRIILETVPATHPPAGYDPLPQAGYSLTEFLSNLTSAQKPIELCFTGHSLGGALAPTLALWFKQAQGKHISPKNDFYTIPQWDENSVAKISCVAFAGASVGDRGFNRYFQGQLGDNYVRIYNSNDPVPHGFAELYLVSALYGKQIKMTAAQQAGLEILGGVVEFTQNEVHAVYENLPYTKSFLCPVDSMMLEYATQFHYQHVTAYQKEFHLLFA